MRVTTKSIAGTTVAIGLLLSSGAAAQTADIVDTANGNPNFSTLVSAIKAAGLVDTLKGKGPFTVFAPTNDAFKKLPAGTLDELLKPESKAKLASILKYHVLPGAYDAARFGRAKAKQFGIKSAEGSNLTLDISKGVAVNGATVSQADVRASNGVIHAIDAVIVPPKIKAGMRAAELKTKAAEKAAALKTKAAEAAAAMKAKAAEIKDKAKAAAGNAGAAVKSTITPPAPTGATPAPKRP